jgi:hypothetical protein
VYVGSCILREDCEATDQHPLLVRIIFDDDPIEHSFNNVLTFKPLFQGMSHGMTSNEIVSSSNSFADSVDVHVAYPLMMVLPKIGGNPLPTGVLIIS